MYRLLSDVSSTETKNGRTEMLHRRIALRGLQHCYTGTRQIDGSRSCSISVLPPLAESLRVGGRSLGDTLVIFDDVGSTITQEGRGVSLQGQRLPSHPYQQSPPSPPSIAQQGTASNMQVGQQRPGNSTRFRRVFLVCVLFATFSRRARSQPWSNSGLRFLGFCPRFLACP